MKKFFKNSILLLAFIPFLVFSQSKTITGTVNDEFGIPLPGVAVQ